MRPERSRHFQDCRPSTRAPTAARAGHRPAIRTPHLRPRYPCWRAGVALHGRPQPGARWSSSSRPPSRGKPNAPTDVSAPSASRGVEPDAARTPVIEHATTTW